MKIKEITVGIAYPYQLAQFMFGKVELAEVILIEEGDDPEQVKKQAFDKLLRQCKDDATAIIAGPESPVEKEESHTGQAPNSTLPRKRRF